MNIYVGNIAHAMKEEDVREVFEEFREVTSARIITDKFSGRSRGFGFVEMADQADGEKAIAELNGAEVQGRPLTVNEARPKTEGGGGGGNRGRGGYGGGGRGGYGGGGGGRGRGGNDRGGNDRGGNDRGGNDRGPRGGGGGYGGDRKKY